MLVQGPFAMHPPSGNDIADKALLKLAPVPLVAYRNRCYPVGNG